MERPVPPTTWPDVAKYFCVVAGSGWIVRLDPSVAKWGLLVLTAIASPALVRAALDRFRR